ncbi:hypothetical protein FRX31_019362 [Thalictrum thalictroides]|uniref:Uncharacterized protein n=1 Tax=Thalictrum thalictroides TaxID=46969 RepID=A0A7J6W1J6_THATH|nr:hypothetical protein FRX31_019362 [Thalictrum thalictroides]
MIQLTVDPPLLGLELFNEFKLLSRLFEAVNAKVYRIRSRLNELNKLCFCWTIVWRKNIILLVDPSKLEHPA